MRVLLADPPAFTPWYDHELAAALARAGADVELATSRFRFGAIPAPDGYRRSERFYPLSSRLFRRSRLRLPLKAVEHLDVLRRLGRAKPDVLHLQWLALPQADVRLRFRAPAVFTAHDLLPRRTASRRDLWQRLLAKFDRVVVHTERGRETLAELGIDARVIPHPVYPERGDAGRRRPHAALARRDPAVQGPARRDRGDAAPPATRGCSSRAIRRCRSTACAAPSASNGGSATSRRRELDRALSEATVAVFPYRAELDQSGALLQALGAGPARWSSTTWPASASRFAATAPGASCRRATSTR